MSDGLALFATRWQGSRGRLHREPESATRTPFQRDRDRVIHSTAFRRLKHKTQVFVSPEGDHFRTRLTHSLEVSQIARTIARRLRLDEDLAECLALAHDLGHTPFGHSGEEALDEVMRPWGGFDHNDQTLRVMTRLEQRYAEFDGLNPTWETLEGVVKHNGPLVVAASADRSALPPTIAEIDAAWDLELGTWPGAEAQAAAIADDIAYDHHDLDDGLRAGLFDMESLRVVPHVGAVFDEVRARYPSADAGRLVHEAVRRLIGAMVHDVLEEAERRLARSSPRHAEDIRNLDHPVVAFSEAMREKDRVLKQFLFENMYRHDSVMAEARDAAETVKDLFRWLMADSRRLPEDWRRTAARCDEAGLGRLVADYIAGMTDRYAAQLHRRLRIGPGD